MIQALIIDDEQDAIDALLSFTQRYCPQVNVIGTAQSMEEGVQLVRGTDPDLVFLDINLGDGTGFDVLEKTKGMSYKTIFTTAYNEYGIKAFRYAAIDYLLKPIDPDQLSDAVSRITKEDHLTWEQMTQMMEVYLGRKQEKIILPGLDEYLSVKVKEVVRCQADGNYTRFHFESGETFLVAVTMKEYEELLPASNFVRVHHSHLVNLDFINKFVKTDGGYLVMSDDTQVPVSRRKKQTLFDKLGLT